MRKKLHCETRDLTKAALVQVVELLQLGLRVLVRWSAAVAAARSPDSATEEALVAREAVVGGPQISQTAQLLGELSAPLQPCLTKTEAPGALC